LNIAFSDIEYMDNICRFMFSLFSIKSAIVLTQSETAFIDVDM